MELLTDKMCREVISWVGEDGEFKLVNPEVVAQMWGQRKNKPTMNYEKLSRALRYYYDGDMIAKVWALLTICQDIKDLVMASKGIFRKKFVNLFKFIIKLLQKKLEFLVIRKYNLLYCLCHAQSLLR